jgi:hypothetical protein
MLQWTTTDFGSQEGRAGKIRLFTIAWGLTREKGKGQYRLRTQLPGIQKAAEEGRFQTPEEAQARAEELLDVFMKHVTNNR